MDLIVNILAMTVPFSVALLLASIGEMFNQRSGVFNLGCEGIMAMGAFLGMLIPFSVGQGGHVSQVYNVAGLLAATVCGALLALFFGLIVITFRAPQGIAGIGLQMFGVGTAGTLFRHFVGGTQSIPGIPDTPVPLLSRIPVIGDIFFSHNILVYIAFLLVPVAWYVLFKTSWGLKVRAVGSYPRAADSMGINVNRTKFIALLISGLLASFGGIFMSMAYIPYFTKDMVSGRGFIGIAACNLASGHPIGAALFALVFGAADALANIAQGFRLPYQFASMIPYIITIIGLCFAGMSGTRKKKVKAK